MTQQTRNLQVRIPAELHQKIKLLATLEGGTVTDMVIHLLEQRVQQYAERDVEKLIRSGQEPS